MHSATGDLQKKISMLSNEKESIVAKNSLLNKELEESQAKAEEVKFKENPSNLENKVTNSSNTSLKTVDDIRNVISSNMSDADANRLTEYLNAFIFNNTDTAINTLNSAVPTRTLSLLTGI